MTVIKDSDAAIACGRSIERATECTAEVERVDRLRESNADLVEALEPFAHVAGFFENADDDTSITVYAAGSHRGNERDPWQEKLTVGDCRSARDAIIRALDTEHEAE